MINIAICDDSLQACIKMQEYILRVQEEIQGDFHLYTFHNAEEMLKGLPQDTDILFLDIVMAKETGMDAAKKLRTYNKDVCIIFISSMPQYALEAYGVRAFGFLKKPVEYHTFRSELLEALHTISKKQGIRIVLKSAGNMSVFQTSEIYYAESIGKKLIIHLENLEKEFYLTMNEFEEQVRNSGFFRCHKSFIVNFQYVVNIDSTDVLLSNQEKVPISKHRRKDFLQEFTAYVANHDMNIV